MKWEKHSGWIQAGAYHVFSHRVSSGVVYTASVNGQVLGMVRDVPVDDQEAKKKALDELRALCEQHESTTPPAG